jgi:hypothetical protein
MLEVAEEADLAEDALGVDEVFKHFGDLFDCHAIAGLNILRRSIRLLAQATSKPYATTPYAPRPINVD